MSTRNRGLWLAVVVFAALVLIGAGCTKKPDTQISVAGVTNMDSLTLRDDLVVGKASTLGSGGLAVTGNFSLSNGSIINTKGAVTVTDGLNVTSQVVAANGLSVAGYVTMSTGALVNSNGAVSVTDSLDVSSQIVAGNGVKVTGGMTLTASGDLVMAGGNIWDDTNDVTVMDDMGVEGRLDVTGVMTAEAGLVSLNNISSTGAISVTNWGLFYGVALEPAYTQVVTAEYGITPTSYSVMYIQDDGGQATGTILLNAATSIVSGTIQGQMLLVFWMDADGATLTITDGGNVQGPGNANIVLGYLDSALFMWDNVTKDWLTLNVSDL